MSDKYTLNNYVLLARFPMCYCQYFNSKELVSPSKLKTQTQTKSNLKPVYHYFISNALLEKIEPPFFTLKNHPLELNILILLPLFQESISKQPLCARRNFTTITLYLYENVGNDRGNINNFIFLGPICTNLSPLHKVSMLNLCDQTLRLKSINLCRPHSRNDQKWGGGGITFSPPPSQNNV